MEDSNSAAELQHDRQQSAATEAQLRLHNYALEQVVQTVMRFGQYPQPSSRRHVPIQFSLADWILENYEACALADYLALSMDYGPEFDMKRHEMDRQMEGFLRAKFKGSDLVAERAASLAAEELEGRQ